MNTMKKVIALVLVVALTAVASISATMAYLQDEDSDVNVMTLGNVKIDQIEQERDANGELVNFTQAKPAYPAVGPIQWADTGVEVNGTEYKVFTPDLKNVIDKIVTVKNTGISDAYVRTLVAVEAPGFDPNDLIHLNHNSTGVSISDPVMVNIEGVDYVVFAFTYAEALAAGNVSAPSLMQVFLDSAATNDDCAKFGDSWEILVLSQAVQTNGFDNAATALDTAFGEVNAENIKAWMSDMETPEVVADANEVFNSTKESGSYILGADYKSSDSEDSYSAYREFAIRDDKDYILDLNGHTITNDTTYQNGNSTGYTYLYTVAYNSTLTINGEGTIYSENADGNTAIIYAQSTGEAVINGGDFHAVRGTPVWAGNGSRITINGGSFTSSGSEYELIYSSGGIIDIYGGFFHNTGWENRPVNVADANRGTGRINIYGGTFVNFDPSTGGDDPDNIKVMEGYKVVSETKDNGDIWYTVVPA